MNSSYTYNANGDQVTRTLNGTSFTLTYNSKGELGGITGGGTTDKSFAYDALERRVSRTAGTTTTTFVRTGDVNGGIILNEKQGSTVTASYTYGNGLLAKGSESYLFDGQGSTRQVTNTAGTVTSSSTSDGFGNTVASSGTKPEYGYNAQSGYRDDGDAGLVHIAARYYDAQVGLFTTRDTFLDQKPYKYCEHDPVNATDPSGHFTIIEVMIMILVIVLVAAFFVPHWIRSHPPKPTPSPSPSDKKRKRPRPSPSPSDKYPDDKSPYNSDGAMEWIDNQQRRSPP